MRQYTRTTNDDTPAYGMQHRVQGRVTNACPPTSLVLSVYYVHAHHQIAERFKTASPKNLKEIR